MRIEVGGCRSCLTSAGEYTIASINNNNQGQILFILPLFSLTIFQGGCANVIVSLTTQCPQDLTPYSGKVCLLVSGFKGAFCCCGVSFLAEE